MDIRHATRSPVISVCCLDQEGIQSIVGNNARVPEIRSKCRIMMPCRERVSSITICVSRTACKIKRNAFAIR